MFSSRQQDHRTDDRRGQNFKYVWLGIWADTQSKTGLWNRQKHASQFEWGADHMGYGQRLPPNSSQLSKGVKHKTQPQFSHDLSGLRTNRPPLGLYYLNSKGANHRQWGSLGRWLAHRDPAHLKLPHRQLSRIREHLQQNGAVIPAMFRLKRSSSRNVGRTRIVTNLYGSIALLALFSLTLGMDFVSIAHDLGRGDPYQVVCWTEFSACVAVAAIISDSFWIHRWIQRLTRLDSEQKVDCASR